MFTPLLLLAALTAPVQASDAETSITTRPFRLAWPAADLRVERKRSDTFSVFGQVTAGRYNPLLVRLFGSALAAGGVRLEMNTYGGGAGANYYLQGFDQGWYGGGSLGYSVQTYAIDMDGDAIEGRLQTVLIAPHAGYKYIGDNGFTFAWELGAGYATVFGNTVTAGRSTVKAPADSGVQLTSGLFFGWSF